MTPVKLGTLAVLLSALALVAVAWGGGDRPETGVILDVVGSSLTTVDSFTLLVDNCDVLTVEIGPGASKGRTE